MTRQWKVWLCVAIGFGAIIAAAGAMRSEHCRETVRISGKFCLSRDLSLRRGIVIGADDVSVDLGGHCLIGPHTPENLATGFRIEGPRKNVVIRNGCVAGFMYGIRSEPGSSRVLIENVALRRNTFRAALIESDDARVIESVIDSVGGTSVFADASTMGLELRGKRTLVERTQVSEVYPVGSGDSVGISVSGPDGRLVGNTVLNNDRPQWGRSYGIAGLKDTEVRGNACIRQTYSFSGVTANENMSSEEDCASLSTTCPDNIRTALDALAVHDADDGRRLFRVGRAYHKAKDYPKAAIYYLAADRAGIAEGNRIVERHLKFGYITADDRALAERESIALVSR